VGAIRVVELSAYGLLSVADAAARRGVSARTVQRWVAIGAVPVALAAAGRNGTGGVYLIPVKELDAYAPGPMGAPPGNEFSKKKDAKTPRKTRVRKVSGNKSGNP